MGITASSAQPRDPAPPPLALAQSAIAAPSADGFLPEILELLAAFLVGYDVLQLAHVNRDFRSALATPSVWASRIRGTHRDASKPPPPLHKWCDEQSAYFGARSLLFRGLKSLSSGPRKKPRNAFLEIMRPTRAPESNCGDACALPFLVLPEEDGRLSFDVWFSLLPVDTPGNGGGILLAAQSCSCFDPNHTLHHYDRFVHIDPGHNLYCSVLISKPVVASDLEVNRWYHVALTFDGRRQHVYLDGELVSAGSGLSPPQDKWHWTRSVQLGTGFIAESSRGKPTAAFSGWYPFHGLVDECRVWHDVLSEQEIEQLARGRPVAPQPVFQLTSDKLQRREGVRRVKCSRPVERQARIHSH
jgi:hypothetical protein